MVKLSTHFIISTLGVTLFALIYDVFVKGHITGITTGDITGTVVLTKLLLAGMLAYIFGLKYENKGLYEGLRFGVIIGLLLGFVGLQGFSSLVDTDSVVKLLLDTLLFGVGSGVVLSILYKSVR